MYKLVTAFALSASLLPSASAPATIHYGELTRDEYCRILEFEMREDYAVVAKEEKAALIPSFWPSDNQERRKAHTLFCYHRLLIS